MGAEGQLGPAWAGRSIRRKATQFHKNDLPRNLNKSMFWEVVLKLSSEGLSMVNCARKRELQQGEEDVQRPWGRGQ